MGSILASGLLWRSADGQRCLLQLKPDPLGGPKETRMSGIEISRLTFEFQLSPPDGALSNRWERLLNVVADFQLVVDHEILYSEAQFPVVEFASQLSAWLANSPSGLKPFSYDSLESDELGLVRFEPQADAWRVAAAHQARPSSARFSTAELCEACHRFLDQVRSAVQQAHAFDPFAPQPPLRGAGDA